MLAACGGSSYDDSGARTCGATAPSTAAMRPRRSRRELVRYATLAPSSHNTQCWKFALEERGDHDPARLRAPLPGGRPRRPPPVRVAGLRGREPDRRPRARTACAAQAELRRAARRACASRSSLRRPQTSALFKAIPRGSRTRAEYDGKPIARRRADARSSAAATGDRVQRAAADRASRRSRTCSSSSSRATPRR
ncbi:MAG: hypothetical protein MZW92_41195 [Comamonadaceae bacterium]|nr:hypothetical protein [Comamonadaceae bacterium]